MEIFTKSDQLPHDLEKVGLRLRVLKIEAFPFIDFRLVNLLQDLVLMYSVLQFNFVLLNDALALGLLLLLLSLDLRALCFQRRALELLFDLERLSLGVGKAIAHMSGLSELVALVAGGLQVAIRVEHVTGLDDSAIELGCAGQHVLLLVLVLVFGLIISLKVNRRSRGWLLLSAQGRRHHRVVGHSRDLMLSSYSTLFDIDQGLVLLLRRVPLHFLFERALFQKSINFA